MLDKIQFSLLTVSALYKKKSPHFKTLLNVPTAKTKLGKISGNVLGKNVFNSKNPCISSVLLSPTTSFAELNPGLWN